MKKTFVFLSLFVLLSGCGGGGEGDVILANVQVSIQGFAGGGQAGRALNISGGGTSYTCSQTPNNQVAATANDPRCQLPTTGGGSNADTPLIFNDLPTGVTYTFTEVSQNGTAVASGGDPCSFTIIDSATMSPPSGSQCILGDPTENQLTLTIQMV